HKHFEKHRQFNEIDIRMPADVIPDSPECRVNIGGNLMGLTVSAVINDNIQDLITRPGGHGETILIRTAPNLYTLMYLSAINRLTPDIEQTLKRHIRNGYYGEISYYKKGSGCFSIWTHTPCSTWLTAFAMKVFCQTTKFIFIEPTVLCDTASWLLTMQNDNGSFIENYRVYHKEMS
ncbi:alpha-2-macroglobulin-P-like, partial [Saccoglossus kowalevskii]